MKMCLNLNDFIKIKSFAQKVVTFSDDVIILKNGAIYDAKSIISLIVLLDFSDNINVELVTQNRSEIERFRELMKEFEV